VTREFWLERWRDNRLGWHKSEVNQNLTNHVVALTGGVARTVLVPLCGKTVDLAWLAAAGHRAIGIELAESAATQFFTEHSIDAHASQTAGGLKRFAGGGVEIICADFFDVTRADLPTIDCVWDRAALVALAPDVRDRYCAALQAFAPGPILLNSFSYDPRKMDGPPYSVTEDEVRRHFAKRNIDILASNDVIDSVAFKDRGLESFWSSLYLID